MRYLFFNRSISKASQSSILNFKSPSIGLPDALDGHDKAPITVNASHTTTLLLLAQVSRTPPSPSGDTSSGARRLQIALGRALVLRTRPYVGASSPGGVQALEALGMSSVAMAYAITVADTCFWKAATPFAFPNPKGKKVGASHHGRLHLVSDASRSKTQTSTPLKPQPLTSSNVPHTSSYRVRAVSKSPPPHRGRTISYRA